MNQKGASFKGWFNKAEEDLKVARMIVRAGDPLSLACFHFQQTGEKYLKGFFLQRVKTFKKFTT